MLDSIQEILDRCRAEDVPFWRVIRESDMDQRQVTAEESRERMRQTWLAMLESEESYQAQRRSLSGLVGGDGGRMRDFAAQGQSLSGDYPARSSPPPFGWGRATPACERSWRPPRRGPAACCRRF